MKEKVVQNVIYKGKIVFLTYVCLSSGESKRYEGGDSNHTIYFERPKAKNALPISKKDPGSYSNASKLNLYYDVEYTATQFQTYAILFFFKF